MTINNIFDLDGYFGAKPVKSSTDLSAVMEKVRHELLGRGIIADVALLQDPQDPSGSRNLALLKVHDAERVAQVQGLMDSPTFQGVVGFEPQPERLRVSVVHGQQPLGMAL